MKIICIGRNYRDHALELNNPLPTTPLIFIKPSTALLLDGKAFYHPDFSINIQHEIELVVKVKKNGRHIDSSFSHTYYEEIGLGIDFTARDLQDNLKAQGHPWEIAKAFDHSAVVGKFVHKNDLDLSNMRFRLSKNGADIQKGESKDLIFSIDYLISYISKYFTLQKGDLIYTGTPAGVGKVAIGEKYVGYLENENLLECEIK
jgi:acylpyruvate hydrolase